MNLKLNKISLIGLAVVSIQTCLPIASHAVNLDNPTQSVLIAATEDGCEPTAEIACEPPTPGGLPPRGTTRSDNSTTVIIKPRQPDTDPCTPPLDGSPVTDPSCTQPSPAPTTNPPNSSNGEVAPFPKGVIYRPRPLGRPPAP